MQNFQKQQLSLSGQIWSKSTGLSMQLVYVSQYSIVYTYVYRYIIHYMTCTSWLSSYLYKANRTQNILIGYVMPLENRAVQKKKTF